MAQFFGQVEGSRGEVHRLGTKSSGLVVFAASWSGRIKIELYHDEDSGEDRFHVIQDTHKGAGIYENIASGVLGKPINNAKAAKGDKDETTS